MLVAQFSFTTFTSIALPGVLVFVPRPSNRSSVLSDAKALSWCLFPMIRLPIIVALLLGTSLLSSFSAAAPALPSAAAPPPFAQLTAAASSTTCNLKLEGYGDSPGLKAASLKCNGAVLTATAAPQLLKALGPQAQAREIKWRPSCSSDVRCLLTICESSVTFSFPVVQDILLTDPGTEALICIDDNSSVIMQNGAFRNWQSLDRNTFVAVKVSSSSASLVLSDTTFVRGVHAMGSVDEVPYGGALMAVAGRTTVVSGTFVNGFTVQGGAIVASGNAQVDIGSNPDGESSEVTHHQVCHAARFVKHGVAAVICRRSHSSSC